MPAPTERVDHPDDVPAALARLSVDRDRPVLVVVGGASGMDDRSVQIARRRFDGAVVAVCEELGAVVVDGGTDAGLMRISGSARADAGATFPVIGVLAIGTIDGPSATVDDTATPEPNHTHFVLVPGDRWGDESPWILRVAHAIAGSTAPIVGLLAGGGTVAANDVHLLLGDGRPVVVLSDTGGLAEDVAKPAAPSRGAVITLGSDDPDVEVADTLRRLMFSTSS